MNNVIATCGQPEVHMNGKEDIKIDSGECMVEHEEYEGKRFTKIGNRKVTIQYTKNDSSDETALINDIRGLMESLILKQLNQDVQCKGE